MFRELLNGENGASIRKGIETSSVSALDAEARANNWDKVFSNLDEIIEDRTYAAGSPTYANNGLHGVEFFDATVAAMIKSYAGIFAIERSMEQPNASLPFMNLYGVKTGEKITPNIGPSLTFTEADGYVKKNITVVGGTPFLLDVPGTGEAIPAIGITPGTVKLTHTDNNGDVVTLTDNGAGYLVGPAGVITAGTVEYGLDNQTGNLPVITVNFVADGTVVVEFVQETPQKLNEKIKPELEYYSASTNPVIVPYEINQVANLSAKKALGMDMRGMTLTQITDEYTKIINKKTVDGVESSAKSKNEATIDVSAFTIATSDYRTMLESFMSQLRSIDTVMAKKTEKSVNVSAFLVSLRLGDIFSQLELVTSKWVPNKDISYVDDIIGYFDGIPVVRSKFVDDASGTVYQGYAIHKTKEGQLAPLMRGMFLPLTNMDEVGSFDNPLLKSGGIFSYEGVSTLTKDLTVGFQVKIKSASGVGSVIA